MVPAEISFSTGSLRQPGVWGKILVPPASGIYDINMTPGTHLTVKGGKSVVTPEHLQENMLLVFGVRGFQQAGILTSCFLLMRVKPGSHMDWQFPGHLTHFSGKEVELLGQAEQDPTTIYQLMKDQGGYLDPDRVRQTLRNEGKDRSFESGR
jgi:hypothetical protein